MSILQKSLFIGLSLYTLTSAAALFDDTEARKKILDLEAKVQTKLDSQSAEIEDLKNGFLFKVKGCWICRAKLSYSNKRQLN